MEDPGSIPEISQSLDRHSASQRNSYSLESTPESLDLFLEEIASQSSLLTFKRKTVSVGNEETGAVVKQETTPPKNTPHKSILSPEQIEQNRQTAMERLKRFREGIYREKLISLTESLKTRMEEEEQIKHEIRKKKRAELGSKSLLTYGIKVKDPGKKPEMDHDFGSSIKIEVDEFGTPLKIKGPQKWTPDESCTEEQLRVLDMIRNGQNVFFTGSAGVGKSFLLGQVRQLLTSMIKSYSVTATTGIAALQIDGRTIHSWARVGIAQDPFHVLAEQLGALDRSAVVQQTQRNQSWLSTHVLIIDEISMLDPGFFERLNVLGKLIRRDPRPFGGIQLVVTGDFFQLPPVPDKRLRCPRCGEEGMVDTKLVLTDGFQNECIPDNAVQCNVWACKDVFIDGKRHLRCGFQMRRRKFVFETDTWAECRFQVQELKQVFRQIDPEFVSVLEKVRRGVCDEKCMEFFSKCGGGLKDIKIKPTNLYPIRRLVEAENRDAFEKLEEECYTFKACDGYFGKLGRYERKSRLRDLNIPDCLQLKIGAQVILLHNLDLSRGLANGSRGCVVGWEPIPNVSLDENETLSNVNPRTKDYYSKAERIYRIEQECNLLPRVFFASGHEAVIGPNTWTVEIDQGNVITRTQIPLNLAWALTIHKSQGQSLDAAGIRLSRTFEKGQAYVALSRCRTREGMQIEGLNPELVEADSSVIAFYDQISQSKPYRLGPTPIVNPLKYFLDCSKVPNHIWDLFGNYRHIPLPNAEPSVPSLENDIKRIPTDTLALLHKIPVTGNVVGQSWKNIIDEAVELFQLNNSNSDLQELVTYVNSKYGNIDNKRSSQAKITDQDLHRENMREINDKFIKEMEIYDKSTIQVKVENGGLRPSKKRRRRRSRNILEF